VGHTILQSATPEVLTSYLRFRNGKRVKLGISTEHDTRLRQIIFTLDRHLPGEEGKPFFMYANTPIYPAASVKRPLVSRCETPQVRSFLNELQYERQIEVLSFGLVQTELRYGTQVQFEKAVQVFVNACSQALSIESHEEIVVLTPIA
jgi:hypothetical protein